ncbi:ferritin-like fold-containing protein [Ruicaihuangia caeni]|uniref:ferritin-like fold-containing protein n=1 Tax=Ruicaihuangia caeni TaxID=3042517 RepID=UPI0033900C5A
MKWLGRARLRVPAPTVKPRSAVSNAARVELAELAPDTLEFLADAAVLQLAHFETLSRAVLAAPDTAAKSSLGRTASQALDKHHDLVEELRRRGADPEAAMERAAAHIQEFRAHVQGSDWFEVLMVAYITATFLDDFFLSVAQGLPDADTAKIVSVLARDSAEHGLFVQLSAGIQRDPQLASRLAMWGRRLIGDTILLARKSLAFSGTPADEAHIEPVFTELIAAHTRRMDALGLTA